MLYFETPSGTFEPMDFTRPVDGYRYPPNIGSLMSPGELAALGLYEPAPADAIPAGKVSTGTVVQRIGGVVKFVHTLEDIPIAELRQNKLLELADRRWQAESGGTDFGPYRVKTDRETSAVLTAAMVKVIVNPSFTIPNWKVSEGVFITLDATTIGGLAETVSAHVQACFDREADLAASILAAADAADLNAIDIDVGWPG